MDVSDEVALSAEDQSLLSVYPNPSQGSITIRVSEPSKVMIVTTSGRELFNKHVEESISLDNFHSGIYIVRMNGRSKVATQKLVIK